jgi:hypothetical protein
MGGSVPAKQAVLRFWRAAGAGAADAKAQLAAPAGSHVYRKQEGVARVAAPEPSAPSGRGAGGDAAGTAPSRSGGAGAAGRGVELPPPSQPVMAKDGSKVRGIAGSAGEAILPQGWRGVRLAAWCIELAIPTKP